MRLTRAIGRPKCHCSMSLELNVSYLRLVSPVHSKSKPQVTLTVPSYNADGGIDHLRSVEQIRRARPKTSPPDGRKVIPRLLPNPPICLVP